MKILITGANGFIGKNLKHHLVERNDVEIVCFTHANDVSDLPLLLEGVEFVFHLAGVNRPYSPQEFVVGNVDLTAALIEAMADEMLRHGRKINLVYASSIQATQDTPYGKSKRVAEDLLIAFAERTGISAHVFRLPNVFGKWCRPNYNSAVATFCHNIARGQPIHVDDPDKSLTLVYVEDVIECFIRQMDGFKASQDADGFATLSTQYTVTLSELVRQITAFRSSRETLVSERVGTGFVRALYSTYVSYLPPDSFGYYVPQHRDSRGVFVEMLKTPDCGQFSFFTVHPGITRGGHYHHTKTEKFLVIKGKARFRFRHTQTGELHELMSTGSKAKIIETVPGWTHDITNIGNDEMVVMLWANEVFDRSNPDTFASPL